MLEAIRSELGEAGLARLSGLQLFWVDRNCVLGGNTNLRKKASSALWVKRMSDSRMPFGKCNGCCICLNGNIRLLSNL